jgi:hypothetical protein
MATERKPWDDEETPQPDPRNWAEMTPYEFEQEKRKEIAKGEAAKLERERLRQAEDQARHFRNGGSVYVR